MSSMERSATIDAEPEAVWAVLADFGALAAWAPVIQHSCLLSDQLDGVGATRRVQLADQALVERVVTWDAPRALGYAIEGLPPIVGPVTNTWTLAPLRPRTRVTVTTVVETGWNPVRRLVAGKVLERMAPVSELMLAGLTEAATRGVTPDERPTTSEPEGSDE